MLRFNSSGKLQNEIDRWLDLHVTPLAANESNGFTAWRSGFTGPLFIYGAGGLGRKLAGGLLDEGVAIEGFCDSNPAVWGREILGLPVISPELAASRADTSGGFVISTWALGRESNNSAIRHTLERLGVHRWVFFTTPFWQYSRRFLPHYRIDRPSRLLASRADLMAAAELFVDDESRRQFFVQLQMLVTTTFDEISYTTPGDTYFPDDLVSPRMLRRFVDCGAFDGDTLQTLLRHAGDTIEHYWGFEPDPQNLQRLRLAVAESGVGQLGRADVYPYALGRENGVLRFDATGDVGARIAASGGMQVECRRLDDVLFGAEPSFIKMDIEGAELDALTGATRLLQENQPSCAVCVYHYQDHLWNVPLQLKEAVPGHSIHFRAHAETSDVVCYAVALDQA